MNPVKIAVVGLGAMGGYLSELYAQMPEYELVAVCDIDEGRRTVKSQALCVPGYVDLVEMLAKHKDIQVVDVAVKSDFHLGPALMCIEAGKHVLLESPMATSVADGEAMIAAAEKNGVCLMVNESLRFDPRYATMVEAVLRGDIGEVTYIFARRAFSQRVAKRAAGVHSVAWEVAQHDIDLMLWITGRNITKVFAKGRIHNLKELGVHDVIISTMTFEDGTIAVLENSWGIPDIPGRPKGRAFQVRGSKGLVEVDGYEQGVTIYTPETVRNPETYWMVKLYGRHSGVYRDQATYFARAFSEGKDSMDTAHHNLEAIKVQEAIQRSLDAGVEVTVQP
jgi:predicted dehydrogenase